MAKLHVDSQHLLRKLYWMVPDGTQVVGAVLDGDKLVLDVQGPSIPDVDEVKAADAQHEEQCTVVSTRTVFVAA